MYIEAKLYIGVGNCLSFAHLGKTELIVPLDLITERSAYLNW